MKNQAELITLPKITDLRGNLSFVEGQKHIPFNIKRAYWIYDVPGGIDRDPHAFKKQEEFIIALSGSFDVVTKTKSSEQVFSLNRSYFGLYVPNGVWRQMVNFSTNSLALVVSSRHYEEQDYIRDWKAYQEYSFELKKLYSASSIPENKEKQTHSFLQNSRVSDCKVKELDKNHRNKGNLTVVENQVDIPFDIRRVYYLYDVPGGEERGGHAHKNLFQVIVAASGSFDVILDDGFQQLRVSLNRPYQALYVVPGIWRQLENFSSGSSCLVLASDVYQEADYIRNYEEFKVIKIAEK